jgi:hypothetical protein
MQLMADPQMVGQLVKCPGCNTKLQVPSPFGADGSDLGAGGTSKHPGRAVWKEQDPTNPNAILSLGIGLGITLIWFGIIYFFQAPPDKVSSQFTTGETLANLFYKHFSVSFANTLFFCWAAAICHLKMLKLRHQRRAMLLDVLPMSLGEKISVHNIGSFIDHVYGLPETLRDSLMVNRIRKALEFFEVRQNVADVSTLMSSQSGIDGSRIMGSYILVRAFLWAIPLLGFIGTVVGLSHAISGMSFSNVEDVSKIVGSINNVTSGLGTAFDATLLGLIFAVLLNFPLNSLAKHEEEALNDIDAFCNEVLLPRLDDGAAAKEEKQEPSTSSSVAAVAEVFVNAVHSSQTDFLADLNALSARMLDYANSLEHRNEQYQQAALQHIADHMAVVDARTHEHLTIVREQHDAVMNSFNQSLANLDHAMREAYGTMVQSQNSVVEEFTTKLDKISTSVESALTLTSEGTNRAVIGIGEHVGKLQDTSKQYQEAVQKAQQEALKLFSEKVGASTSGLADSLSKSVELVQEKVSSIDTGIRSLNSVLEKLGNQQVVVQQVQKKGWFSRG